MDGSVIEVRDLTKDFTVHRRGPGLRNAVKALVKPDHQVKRALDGISFRIQKGDILGYIGPNGAGKSTTIKLLTGILLPTSGSIAVCGMVPFRQRMEVAKRIGVVFGQRTQLWWNIPSIESLQMMKYIYRIPEDIFQENMGLFREMFELDGVLNAPVRELSLGQKMRIELCASLLHSPEILFLDEPTIGLDVVAKGHIRRFLKDAAFERKVTVILATHDLSDIQKLCSRVLLINQGRILYDGELEELRRRYGRTEVLHMVTEDDLVETTFWRTPGLTVERVDFRKYSFHYDRTLLSASRIVERISRETRIIDFSLQTAEIEEIVSSVYASDGTSSGDGC